MSDWTEPERLLTIPQTVAYLKAHNVTVHPNTVRHWVLTGRVPAHPRRRQAGSRYVSYLIDRVGIDHMLACPFCRSR